MSVRRRVVSRRADGAAIAERLECGHGHALRRRTVRGRVVWCDEAGRSTNLQATTRECAECARVEAERRASGRAER